jgi:hypothetical protein
MDFFFTKNKFALKMSRSRLYRKFAIKSLKSTRACVCYGKHEAEERRRKAPLCESGGCVMKYERALLFAAGVIVGAGAVCFVRSKAGKSAAVAVLSKGLELKERAASMAGQLKETVEDVVAEAKYVNEQKANAN